MRGEEGRAGAEVSLRVRGKYLDGESGYITKLRCQR